jgi:hypothetical protein
MSEIILVDKEDLTNTIEEEKQAWIMKVLTALGVNEKRLKDDDVKEYLMGLQVEIWNNLSAGNIDIFKNGKIVAQWKAPKLIRRKEGTDEHYEVHLNEWAQPFQMQRRKNC